MGDEPHLTTQPLYLKDNSPSTNDKIIHGLDPWAGYDLLLKTVVLRRLIFAIQ